VRALSAGQKVRALLQAFNFEDGVGHPDTLT
jgi:hypothetical protein